MSVIRIGTRGSKLALAQTNRVVAALAETVVDFSGTALRAAERVPTAFVCVFFADCATGLAERAFTAARAFVVRDAAGAVPAEFVARRAVAAVASIVDTSVINNDIKNFLVMVPFLII